MTHPSLRRLVEEWERLLSEELQQSARRVYESAASNLQVALVELGAGLEGLLGGETQRARETLAEELNLAARHLRQAPGFREMARELAVAAGGFCNAASVFSVTENTARAEYPDGPEIRLEEAAAFAAAVKTREPVVAAAGEGEVSPALAASAPSEWVTLAPLVRRGRTIGLLCGWGAPRVAPLELLAQLAAAWEPPASDNEMHWRARRFARVQVAEMRLYFAQNVKSGRERRDLYFALKDRIDEARESYRRLFPIEVDYFHQELVHTLAHGDAALLGGGHPGPLA